MECCCHPEHLTNSLIDGPSARDSTLRILSAFAPAMAAALRCFPAFAVGLPACARGFTFTGLGMGCILVERQAFWRLHQRKPRITGRSHAWLACRRSPAYSHQTPENSTVLI